MIAALLTLSLTGCGLSGDDRPPARVDGRPDIVLVSIDTLRADHVGAYGYARDTTPFLDRLAAAGARFAHARSPSPWTLPSHTTLLTGLNPFTHLVVDDDVKVDLSVPVLPEVLQAAGYATGGFVSTLYVSRRFGFERGFDVFSDFDITDEKKNLSGEVDAEHVVDEALDFARARTDKPLFLFLHLYDAHYPYEAPSPYDARFDRPAQKGDARYRNYFHHAREPLDDAQLAHQIAQYDEEILYLDAQLARLHEALGRRDTVWLVTADHGEEFFERGSWGHAHTLYPEQLRVPMILSGAGVPAGRVIEPAVGLEDVAPTLAAIAGAVIEGDGLDLGPHLGDEPPPARPFIASTSRFKTNRVSLWEADERLDWDLRRRRTELYADPLDATDLARGRRDDAKAKKARLMALLGTPWEADPGAVTVEGGALIGDGAVLRSPLMVKEPRRFAVIPPDAAVSHDGAGPWRAGGGALPPADAAVRYDGVRGGAEVDLSDEETARLRALGYIQDE